MPESTEVLEYTQFILSKFKNKILESVKILKGRYKKHNTFDGYNTLKSGNYKLLDVKSKGKFMYIELLSLDHRSRSKSRSRTRSRSRSKSRSNSKEHSSESIYLGVTLGLSGGWFRSSASGSKSSKDHKSPEHSSKLINGLDTERFDDDIASEYLTAALKHINVEFKFNSGTLYFYDQLSYGTLKVLSQKELDSKLKKLGKDMSDPETTFEDFYDALYKSPKNLSKPIGNLIVNQKIISGVGNYLRADSLWASKISPFRKLKDISKAELKKLYHQIRILIYGAGSKSLKALGKKLKIIRSKASEDKLPSDYNRGFWVYKMETDIHGHEVIVDTLYEGSQKRFIYYTAEQK
jgi:formamidopyrimidine-DNA glycosylase